MSSSFSEAVNFLNASMHANFVEVGALAGIIQNIGLIERVNLAHVRLESERGAVAVQSLVLRENIPLDDRTHGHVRTVLNRHRL